MQIPTQKFPTNDSKVLYDAIRNSYVPDPLAQPEPIEPVRPSEIIAVMEMALDSVQRGVALGHFDKQAAEKLVDPWLKALDPEFMEQIIEFDLVEEETDDERSDLRLRLIDEAIERVASAFFGAMESNDDEAFLGEEAILAEEVLTVSLETHPLLNSPIFLTSTLFPPFGFFYPVPPWIEEILRILEEFHSGLSPDIRSLLQPIFARLGAAIIEILKAGRVDGPRYLQLINALRAYLLALLRAGVPGPVVYGLLLSIINTIRATAGPVVAAAFRAALRIIVGLLIVAGIIRLYDWKLRQKIPGTNLTYREFHSLWMFSFFLKSKCTELISKVSRKSTFFKGLLNHRKQLKKLDERLDNQKTIVHEGTQLRRLILKLIQECEDEISVGTYRRLLEYVTEETNRVARGE